MSIKQVKTGWQVDIKPGGRAGRRVRKTFKKKSEALAWEMYVKSKIQNDPEYTPPKKDIRKLSELCETWYLHHGKELKAGEDTRRRLIKLCEEIGDPLAINFNAEMFAIYRNKRIAQGITINNMNREHAYMRAVFNELIRLEIWKRENPLKNLRAFKLDEKELNYLTLEQIDLLFENMKDNKNLALITKICLSTGARWSEAENLNISQVKNGQIQFIKTKSSKSRSVPIDKNLEQEIINHAKNQNRIFKNCYGQFRKIIEKCNINLPDGQMTHVLRHTFASHFIMNGGNILILQKILGHSSMIMTIKYAHLEPKHLKDAIKFNPLNVNKTATT